MYFKRARYTFYSTMIHGGEIFATILLLEELVNWRLYFVTLLIKIWPWRRLITPRILLINWKRSWLTRIPSKSIGISASYIPLAFSSVLTDFAIDFHSPPRIFHSFRKRCKKQVRHRHVPKWEIHWMICHRESISSIHRRCRSTVNIQ